MTGNPYDPVRASDAMIAAVRVRHPMLIDLTTGRIERLLDKLGRPQDRLPPVIHVAGTNGKGSTCAFLRAIGEAAGLRVHVLTSPHLVRFAERIRLAGTLITDQALEAIIARVEAAAIGEAVSFFELATAAAILAFAETPADLCVIEVGLGGRHDATNVFDRPAVTVLTPIDYDHVDLLGPDLASIAREKSGILRRGVPCIVAHQPDEAFAVIEAQAEHLGAPLIASGRDFDAWEEQGRLLVQLTEGLLDLPAPSLAGAHQFGNAAVAAMAVLTLNHPAITEAAIARGIETADWPARLQRLTMGPLADRANQAGATIWLDGGHNPHAAQALAQTLRHRRARDGRPLVLIIGMLERKDASGFLTAFADLRPRVFTVGFDAPLAIAPAALAETARAAGLDAQPAPDVTTALDLALASGEAAPHILICGSLHFAGEVLALSPQTWPV